MADWQLTDWQRELTKYNVFVYITCHFFLDLFLYLTIFNTNVKSIFFNIYLFFFKYELVHKIETRLWATKTSSLMKKQDSVWICRLYKSLRNLCWRLYLYLISDGIMYFNKLCMAMKFHIEYSWLWNFKRINQEKYVCLHDNGCRLYFSCSCK